MIPEACILCGHCVDACPVGAKRVRDDLRRSIHLVKRKKTFLSLAPSFKGEFKNCSVNQLATAVKSLGFTGVSETALGAEEVSFAVAEFLTERKGLVLSSACPSAVELVLKHLPDFAEYISPFFSPLLAHCCMLRHVYGEEIGIVFVGPCIAKKQEADQFGNLLDVAITFEDLHRWFENEGIDPSEIEPEDKLGFVPRESGRGALYPVEGGMISTVRNRVEKRDAVYLTLSGVDNIRNTLETFDTKHFHRRMFVELLACENGCIGGPKATCRASIDSRLEVIDYAQDKSQILSGEYVNQIMHTFRAESKQNNPVSQDRIAAALATIGKVKSEDELNCGSCGYVSCREFALAMIEKKAEQCMCVSYMRVLAQKQANALLKTIPYGVVIVDKELKIIDCNDNFAQLLGDDIRSIFQVRPGLVNADLRRVLPFHDLFSNVLKTGNDITQHFVKTEDKTYAITIFTVEPNQVAGALVRDATKTEMRREQIIEKAQEVISNTSNTAQEIAFLMGKNAAQSEKILNSLIESFS
ncbi:Fe-only hydrogenase, hydrogen sensor subunit HfsB [Chitinispirillum alkaliphilum]|nr:Fe-only hydrogenase, hydrogen sensor subunit HfsB [Chitinispirillum alkaliphilum]